MAVERVANSWYQASKDALLAAIAAGVIGFSAIVLEVAIVSNPKLELALGRSGTLSVGAFLYGFLALATLVGSVGPFKFLPVRSHMLRRSLQALFPGITIGALFATGFAFRPVSWAEPLLPLPGYPWLFAYVVVLVALLVSLYLSVLRLVLRAAT